MSNRWDSATGGVGDRLSVKEEEQGKLPPVFQMKGHGVYAREAVGGEKPRPDSLHTGIAPPRRRPIIKTIIF